MCVTNLLNSSYHARVVLTPRGLHSGHTVSIDARPSDAINLALRFRSPIYVKKVGAGSLSARLHAMLHQVQAYGCMPVHVLRCSGTPAVITLHGGGCACLTFLTVAVPIRLHH